MSENRDQLAEMADGLFAQLRGQDFDQAWPLLEEAGFGLLLLPEEQGGFGGDWGDLAAVMRLAGQHALAAPLGEHIVARHLLHEAGVDSESFVAIQSGVSVPWGRVAGSVVVDDSGTLALATGDFDEGSSAAGEPRDVLSITESKPLNLTADLQALIAFLRVFQTAGALDAALELAIDHTGQRQQFGRPLSKFQSVQQSIALLAIEAAAVNCAAQGAAAALDRFGIGGEATFEIGAAKLRANIAIKSGSALAHQVHGAIGFTQDYPLHELTRRMMGWRSEGGNDAYWSARLGRQAFAWGGTGLWDEMTRRTDPLVDPA
ncbi:acyl-CoA dehydrogenase family protein [Erythrobacter litoralis]|uniref:Acyl-CoA dehydrogenase, C-terminal n=1 Tax=Erythrobacter litoralis (strain HTCC2594) TaxID=314225 RepID=Q2NBB4_ERYLH|nr:acyl-CoA dehydrogenase family protein [Erythrobacter litoralis]ABC63027.1 Acyl-CoA dehydrogenase, C-terminal [Erythrobacter litoralis HTCC2594]